MVPARVLVAAGLVFGWFATCLGQDHFEEKAEALLDRMTLEEKVGQMVQVSSDWDLTGPAPEDDYRQPKAELLQSGLLGSMLNVTGVEQTREAQRQVLENSRLGIPLIFAYDVIHGYQTMFPIPLGMAASWEPGLVEKAARIAAMEASSAGIHWTFAPMVDVSRDPRWGRVMESAGEDPYLNEVMADAAVRGYQGDDLQAFDTIAACAKHFAAYGFTEDGKDYNTALVDEATLRDVVLPPFQACLEAGVATFMNGFNTLNGIPVTADAGLVRGILKGEWGFEGMMVSDWASIRQLIPHGVAADKREAALLAIRAGSDMDMEGWCYADHLVDLVREGVVPEEMVDEAVLRILRVKFQLGLFEDPYRYVDSERERETIGNPEFRTDAREIARRSIVLLKNEQDILPLRRDSRIAVIGPLGDDKDAPLGNWRARAVSDSAVSLLEGIRVVQPGVPYARGGALFTDRSAQVYNTSDRSGFAEAVALAREVDVVLMAIGEDAYESGEARCKTDLRLKGLQVELLDAVLEVNPNVVVILSHGRPMVISSWADRVPAILATWQLGSESGNAIADVVFGDYNPSGCLPMAFPRNEGQIPVYYNHLSTGRPIVEGESKRHETHYIDAPNSPLFAFGNGLSYTRFAFSNLEVQVSGALPEVLVEVEVDVANIGDRAGEKVVQMYLNDPVASRARPVRELKDFRKIMLPSGESRTVRFTLTAEDLAFWTIHRRMEAEPGTFKIRIGDLEQAFTVRDSG
jgi:beta-glucosidase